MTALPDGKHKNPRVVVTIPKRLFSLPCLYGQCSMVAHNMAA